MTPKSCVFALLLLIQTSVLTYGKPALTIGVDDSENFKINFYPATSLSSADCFVSDCPEDDTVNFYLSELVDENRPDPCHFAASVSQLPRDDIFRVKNNQLDYNVAAFFSTFYGSRSCASDIRQSAIEASQLIELNGLDPVIVNIIEMPVGKVENHTCDVTPICLDRKVLRVNFVLSSWCESNCGIKQNETSGNCDRDYGITKKKLDLAIAKFEVKRLLHLWSNYIAIVDEELAYLEGNRGNTYIPWAELVDTHSDLNHHLYGSFSEQPGVNSLDWALAGILSQQPAKRAVNFENSFVPKVNATKSQRPRILLPTQRSIHEIAKIIL